MGYNNRDGYRFSYISFDVLWMECLYSFFGRIIVRLVGVLRRRNGVYVATACHATLLMISEKTRIFMRLL